MSHWGFGDFQFLKSSPNGHQQPIGPSQLVRFEITARDADRGLIRSVARTLAKGGQEAEQLRSTVSQAIGGNAPTKGGIVAALRRSPLVGVEINVERSNEDGRRVEL